MAKTAFGIEPFIEMTRMSRFDEMTRRDENQFAMLGKVVQAFIDKENKQIRPPVISAQTEFAFGGGQDVLKTHIGRIGDNRIKFMVGRIIEKICRDDAVVGVGGVA